jgi:hypothetical protein
MPWRRRLSLTGLMWLWGCSLLKVSSPGTLIYATRWPQRCSFEQESALHSKCKVVEGLKQKGCTVDHGARTDEGPLLIHSYRWYGNQSMPSVQKVDMLGCFVCRLGLRSWSAVLAKHGCGTSYGMGRCWVGPLRETSLLSNILLLFLFMKYTLDCYG